MSSIGSSKDVSTFQRVVFVLNSAFACALPVYLYHTVFDMDVEQYAPVFGVVTLVAAVILSMAMGNSATKIFGDLISKRGSTITNARIKSVGKLTPEIRAQLEHELRSNSSSEALSYAILYNNAFFYAVFLFFAYYLFASLTPTGNYVASVVGGAGFVYFVSTSRST
ncbi:uncharacterized protein AMSG_05741 [Thecamonas trahens ATCC 50062]|uniref:Translocon-associated protein subunit gamma n=1 Tax=Thecamonas trahens ATCC 50062 TaxID=461836 RepID=A0A0L0DCL4_THETB|nr:hypothetical protein AMSG_05741 [Thecamonas trahens ATCC 50062]KNC49985.1 hypothetical protein AMSG_05741 [Thecamonas trahens ATCC 50062]|eukprot:XP_013757154.1 hypothetical protein AMSG_05741 [Thecamonas trahens ATCC 50062]